MAVVGLAGQLFTASLEGYKILSNAASFGPDYGEFVWRVNQEEQVLLKWADCWLNSAQQQLDASNRSHQHAVATLARIVAVFADIKTFNSKYGLSSSSTAEINRPASAISPAESRGRTRHLLAGLSKKMLRSRSPRPPMISEESIDRLEKSLPLAQQKTVSGLRDEVSRMEAAAIQLQQSLPTWRKLHWAVTDKDKVKFLTERLKGYNEALYRILPPTQAGKKYPSVDIIKLANAQVILQRVVQIPCSQSSCLSRFL